ncbi:hypothetical protein L596_001476 [Steinernema carpocapsae]|uniref:Uncharacterized protein n=1 Tax=Steinernema carpocapsae TaxID=34508 RepID=A0A4U8UMD7_STECR|nr:hypothetical protein L596_001476 [Steinernema carpocapsae]
MKSFFVLMHWSWNKIEGRRSQFADRDFDTFDRPCLADRRANHLYQQQNKGRLRSDTLNVAEESREAVVAEV